MNQPLQPGCGPVLVNEDTHPAPEDLGCGPESIYDAPREGTNRQRKPPECCQDVRGEPHVATCNDREINLDRDLEDDPALPLLGAAERWRLDVGEPRMSHVL